MRWFRMYNEALDDPKVQRLPAADFKGWVNVLMLASRTDGKLPDITDISYGLRISVSEAKKLMSRLYDAGLIDYEAGVANPHNWDVRQYKSDTSTERVKRFRQRSKPVSGNGPEQSRAEIEGKGAQQGSVNGAAYPYSMEGTDRG